MKYITPKFTCDSCKELISGDQIASTFKWVAPYGMSFFGFKFHETHVKHLCYTCTNIINNCNLQGLMEQRNEAMNELYQLKQSFKVKKTKNNKSR